MSSLRVATNSIQESLIQNLNQSQRNLVLLQKQLSSGRRVTLPSDDPIVMGRAIRRESEKSEIAQYHVNNTQAESVVKTSSLYLEQIRDMGELALGIANSTGNNVSNVEIDSYKQQLDEILNQMIDLANGQLDGEYLFAGVNYANPPYSINDGGTTGDETDDLLIDYNGSPTDRTDTDFDEAEIYVGKNTKLAPRLNPEHNEDIQYMLQTVLNLRNAYNRDIGDYDPAAVRDIASTIEEADDGLVIASSDLTTKEMRLNIATKMDSELYNQLDASIADETGADITELAVMIKQSETSYQAALASSSRILNISLLNYI